MSISVNTWSKTESTLCDILLQNKYITQFLTLYFKIVIFCTFFLSCVYFRSLAMHHFFIHKWKWRCSKYNLNDMFVFPYEVFRRKNKYYVWSLHIVIFFSFILYFVVWKFIIPVYQHSTVQYSNYIVTCLQFHLVSHCGIISLPTLSK